MLAALTFRTTPCHSVSMLNLNWSQTISAGIQADPALTSDLGRESPLAPAAVLVVEIFPVVLVVALQVWQWQRCQCQRRLSHR